MSYWKLVLPELEQRGKITCFEIQQITNTTNPQKTVQQLKEKGYISHSENAVSNGKHFKVHYYDKH